MSDSGRSDHVIVCGLHQDGLRVIEQLHRAAVDVVCVDSAPDPRLEHALVELGVPLVHGDARDAHVLDTAGITRACAAVCVESDDLQTVAAALLIRELRPELRVVVQLRNAAIGNALVGLGVLVLDVARLTAPSVVEACLRLDSASLPLGRSEFVLARAEASKDATLRELYGDLAPIAAVSADGAVTVAPGRDVAVSEGDSVLVLGTSEQMSAVGFGGKTAPVRQLHGGARSMHPRRHRTQSLLRVLFSSIDRRIRIIALAMVVVAAISISVLTAAYREPSGRRMSVVDALYFTVETFTTVGYGDFSFRSEPAWLRLWAIGLMIVGAALLAVTFALFTNMLVSRRIEETFGYRHVTGLDDHVVVVGLGSVGLAVIDGLLAVGTRVVVVEREEESRFLTALRARKVPYVIGDATEIATLRTAQAERARAIAVLTSDDLANIETGLAVRDLLGERAGQVPVVLRVFDRGLAHTVSNSFGFSDVRSVAALAAPWFVGAALGFDVLSTFYVADQPLLVARMTVMASSGLVGVPMRDLGAQIRVVALERGNVADSSPRRDTRFEAGDVAYVIGPYDELLRVLRNQDPTDRR